MGGQDFAYHLNEFRAMQEFAARMQLTAGTLLTTRGSRQSIAVQLPTATLGNKGVYLKNTRIVL